MPKELTQSEKDSRNHKLFFFFKLILSFVFPWAELIKMNTLLKKVSSFYKNDFFINQKRKNLFVAILTVSITYLPLLLGFLALKGNRAFDLRTAKIMELLSSFEISSAVKILSITITDPIFLLIIKFTFSVFLIGLLLSNLLIYGVNSIVSDTSKFRKILKKEGILSDDSGEVLFTPVGAFLDISGSSAKEIQNNDRIWLAMNIEIKDYAQNPEKRSELFFKSAFNLKSRYDYVFKK